MANLVMEYVPKHKCSYETKKSMQLSLTMGTEKLEHFHYYFRSLIPPRFG